MLLLPCFTLGRLKIMAHEAGVAGLAHVGLKAFKLD